jgi:hypothetical protein
MPEMILAKIQRCHYCGREVFAPPLDYEQNPFCQVCLPERVGKAAPRGQVRWRRKGNYVIPEVSRKRPRGAHKRRSG